MSTHNSKKDFARQLGPLGLTIRLRRIVDHMTQGARRVYRDLDLEIEPHWHAVILLLESHRDLGVAEIARRLGITHPSASTLVGQMEARGFVSRKHDSSDGRRQVIFLTSRAKKQLPRLKEIWEAGEQAIQSIIDNCEMDVLGTLTAFENELQCNSFESRTRSLID